MPRRGLTVSPQGYLLRDGARFRNVGLNYGGGIQRIYRQTSPTACEYTPAAEQDAMLDVADFCKAKILRVKATPFWPAQWTVGVNGGKTIAAATAADREAHYLKIDAFLAKCRERGIGVILCLFFRHASVADLAGQTVRAGWLTPGSATRNFAQAITQEIVTRYLNEDAVLGYEFSNEVNHYNDASDATRGNYPQPNSTFGTPASYSAANDVFVGSELSGLLSWWYGVASAIDGQRIMLSGNGPNSYSQPGGAAGISSPLVEWHREQVRDNPLNCGGIHWYGNVGYSSPGFRGLNAVLTGANHWQRSRGRGFMLVEFGNQPWTVSAVSASGGVATISCASSCPIDVGDDFVLSSAGPFSGIPLVVSAINGARDSITAACQVSGSFTGAARLQHMTEAKVARLCDDVIKSDTDVALFWALDSDPLTPAWESIAEAGNEGQQRAIRQANTALGW